MRTQYWLRWLVRLILLAAAISLVAVGPVPAWLAKTVPACSPLAAISVTLTARQWMPSLYWAVPPLLLATLAVWKGQLFCRWACPTGTLMSIGGKFSLHKRFLPMRISGVVFWSSLFAALIGRPVLLFLDPLSGFNRLAVPARGLWSVAWLNLGLVLPALLVIGFVQPAIWCTHICPLGYALRVCKRCPGRPGPKPPPTDPVRRDLLLGLIIGAPLALAIRRWAPLHKAPRQLPILPPGAADPVTFASLCSRCYDCVRACPAKIIRISGVDDRALSQLFQPELELRRGACMIDCNACSQVCPTGALNRLGLPAKKARQIGLADIDVSKCLSWAREKPCMKCLEACPYDAINADINDFGTARPVINSDACRGCGACLGACPPEVPIQAIAIEGVPRQRQCQSPLTT